MLPAGGAQGGSMSSEAIDWKALKERPPGLYLFGIGRAEDDPRGEVLRVPLHGGVFNLRRGGSFDQPMHLPSELPILRQFAEVDGLIVVEGGSASLLKISREVHPAEGEIAGVVEEMRGEPGEAVQMAPAELPPVKKRGKNQPEE
jgi:hypothetical protein